MKYLLDTHVLLWALGNSRKLNQDIVTLVESLDNEVYFSSASIWEVAIKNAQGRADFAVDPTVLRRALLDNQYREIAITGIHASVAGTLPPLHKDPFDRMLVAQAQSEGIMLLTADPLVAQYPGPIRLV